MRNQKVIAFFLCMCSAGMVYAQGKKIVSATRVGESIQIDGRLNEPGWLSAVPAIDFIELEPHPGRDAGHQSCVKVLYDDTGVYIGAELDEWQIDHLGTELFERDNLDDNKKIDWFGVVLDCYQNGLNGYGFVVSASGVQTDIKFTSNGDDSAWDAVWDSGVQQYDTYWTCEIKIPYSALRFPEKAEQVWGIQFGRRSYQRQEESFWNPIDPTQNGFLPQAGILTGIRDIKPPVRLSATPFLAVYAENIYDPALTQSSSWGTSYNGGMDVKYGISDAYTLDMTLIPDFGQVQSDNEILNLSPFEVQFEENRQFFTEGIELFQRADIFYSRRVGDTPYYYDQVYEGLSENEMVTSIKQESRLLNATKISGRGKRGTGFGYFNAISPRDYALVRDSISGLEQKVLLQPWTNYNVMVLDQDLKNNSYVSLINSNVMREGIARDANVSGIEFDLRDKPNTYGISGSAAVSQIWNSEKEDSGYKYYIQFSRLSGNLHWNLGYNVESDKFDPNDLGFEDSNNEKAWNGYLEYSEYDPFGPFLDLAAGINLSYSSLYHFPGEPEDQVRPNLFTSAGINWWTNGTFRNYYQFNFWMYMQPTEGYDYFEPRVPGRFFTYSAFKNMGIHISSDVRKKIIAGANARYNKFHEPDKYQVGAGFFINYRLNNHFSLAYEFQNLFKTLDRGYITEIGTDIVFGARDYKDLTQLLRATYTFNPKTTFTFRLRHNWTRVHYTQFYTLLPGGGLEDRIYTENEDINFNAWTIDTQFRWRFAPGSDIFIVWKNNIMGEDDQSGISYGENLKDLFNNPQSNSFSVKMIYYLDFQRWK